MQIRTKGTYMCVWAPHIEDKSYKVHFSIVIIHLTGFIKEMSLHM